MNQPKKLKQDNKHQDSTTEKETALPEILGKLPPEDQQRIAALLVRQEQSIFSSPIPPPEVLKGYNEAIPNGAERILSMAETQAKHRQDLEQHAIRSQIKQSAIGQLFGFSLGIIGIGAATFMAYTGHDTVAGIFGTTTIVGLVAVFVIGRRQQDRSLAEKSKGK